jgi:hypothetical protein
MATTKLTLSVDHKMVEKAKRYAAKHHTSISKLVTAYLKGVTEKDEEAEDPFLTKIREINRGAPKQLHKLRGILKGKVPDDINLWDAKWEYLKEKHGL